MTEDTQFEHATRDSINAMEQAIEHMEDVEYALTPFEEGRSTVIRRWLEDAIAHLEDVTEDEEDTNITGQWKVRDDV